MELPENLDGISFASLLKNPNRPWKKAVFSQFPNPAPSFAPGSSSPEAAAPKPAAHQTAAGPSFVVDPKTVRQTAVVPKTARQTVAGPSPAAEPVVAVATAAGPRLAREKPDSEQQSDKLLSLADTD